MLPASVLRQMVSRSSSCYWLHERLSGLGIDGQASHGSWVTWTGWIATPFGGARTPGSIGKACGREVRSMPTRRRFCVG